MTFDDALKLFEDEEKTKRDVIPTDREVLFRKFMKLVNVSSSDLRKFIDSSESDDVGWTPEEAKKESVTGNYGLADAKILVNVLRKSQSHKNSGVPDLTDDEWNVLARSGAFIARVSQNIGDYKDENGNYTPKYKALYLRAFDGIKAGNKQIPTTQEVKAELKKKMNESISDLVGKANKFL